jgi:hypothetical protein
MSGDAPFDYLPEGPQKVDGLVRGMVRRGLM